MSNPFDIFLFIINEVRWINVQIAADWIFHTAVNITNDSLLISYCLTFTQHLAVTYNLFQQLDWIGFLLPLPTWLLLLNAYCLFIILYIGNEIPYLQIVLTMSLQIVIMKTFSLEGINNTPHGHCKVIWRSSTFIYVLIEETREVTDPLH